MRQRGHFIGLWLDDGEYQHLTKQCAVTGLTASAFVRKCVMGTELRPRPPDTYAALLRELSAIGNNINQIAYWANATKSISAPEIKQVAALARQAWRQVKETL